MSSPPAATARPRVVLVAAVAANGVIGHRGRLPWHLPEELRHFREVTSGHTVVMGRATFQSIGRPLPDRVNIVLTRDPGWSADGVLVAHGLDEALALAADRPGDVMVIGGRQVFQAALPVATHQVLTEVHQSPVGDTCYPPYEAAEWVETRRQDQPGLTFRWIERRPVVNAPSIPADPS